MRNSLKLKIGAVATTFALAGALAVVASGTTGAYFSETRTGAITGTMGSVHIETVGGAAINNPTFTWDGMLPGEWKSAEVSFTNTGSVPQDVYLKFPNLTALSSLNSLGTYGEARISANGEVLYANANLNDKPNNGTTGVPSTLLLASNVAPNASGTMNFEFRYASKIATQFPVFNTYPVPGQITVIEADRSGAGLPWQFVAVQVGQQP